MEPKKKDLMMESFDSFWASDYKIGQPKINVPRVKTAEDDAYDAFWKRGSFAPQPRIQLPQRPQYNIPQRQPSPNYRPQVNQGMTQQNQGLTQQQQYELAKQRLQLQAKLRQQQMARRPQPNYAKTNAFIGSLLRSTVKTGVQMGRAGAKQGISLGKQGVKLAKTINETDEAIRIKKYAAKKATQGYNAARGSSAGRYIADKVDRVKYEGNKILDKTPLKRVEPKRMAPSKIKNYAKQLNIKRHPLTNVANSIYN